MTTQVAIPTLNVEPLDSSRSELHIRVLVVDDNPIDRLRASRLVEQDAQCRSVQASDGAEATSTAGRSRYRHRLDRPPDGRDGRPGAGPIDPQGTCPDSRDPHDGSRERGRCNGGTAPRGHRLRSQAAAVPRAARHPGPRRSAPQSPAAGAASVFSPWSSVNRSSSWVTTQTSFRPCSNSSRMR